MKLSILTTIVLICIQSCTKPSIDINPDSYLSKDDQFALKTELSRYMDKLPPRTSMEQRWDVSRNEYYKRGAEFMQLTRLYKSDTSDFYYFYITKISPSIRQGERKARAGKCTFKNRRINVIEEFFITELASPEKLEEDADELFIEVINTEKAPANNKLIEWPNEYFYYNKNTNQWDRVSSRK